MKKTQTVINLNKKKKLQILKVFKYKIHILSLIYLECSFYTETLFPEVAN